jgi:hypothetical protein
MIFRYQPRFYEVFKRTLTSHPRYPQLARWMQRTARLVDAVYAAADARGFDQAARQALKLHVDKRDVSMAVLLATIRHRATQEYPYLINNAVDHNLTALYASNLNERYWALQLSQAAALANTPVQAALEALRTHLDNIPQD